MLEKKGIQITEGWARNARNAKRVSKTQTNWKKGLSKSL